MKVKKKNKKMKRPERKICAEREREFELNVRGNEIKGEKRGEVWRLGGM